MHQYYYDLQIYEDVIYGELEPTRLQGEQINLAISYLNENLGYCQDMQIVKFKVKNDDFTVTEKLHISNAHPLAKKFFFEQDINFNNDFEDVFAKKITRELKVNKENFQFTISKKKDNVQIVGVCEHSSWEALEPERVKYYYYYQLFSECERKIKRAINSAPFEYTEQELRSLIRNIQKTLMLYLSEIQKYHACNLKKLDYELKPNYSNEDCINLAYISIVQQLNFLYERHSEYFDKSYPVPYYSFKVNSNQIIEKIELIQNQFKRQEIDQTLVEVLEEQFQRILKFDHPKPLTYHEMDYFIELLNELAKYMYRNINMGVSTDEIVHFFCSFRFNNFPFLQYVTNELKKDLETISCNREKEFYLQLKKKNMLQLLRPIKCSYDPESLDVVEFLLQWIEKEIKLLEVLMRNSMDYPEPQKIESIKLETSLSLKQLAAFMKILSECDVIISKSQSEIARWISSSFKTSGQENISIAQSRNHLYNKDPLILEKVKTIAISVVNVVNEKLNALN
jgi:hypothetical protein